MSTEFDPSTIREYSTVLFVGGRRSGISFTMKGLKQAFGWSEVDIQTIQNSLLDPQRKDEKQ